MSTRHTTTIGRDADTLRAFIADALNAPWWLTPAWKAELGPEWCALTGRAALGHLAEIAWDTTGGDTVLLAQRVADDIFEPRAEFTLTPTPSGGADLICEPEVVDQRPEDGVLWRRARRRRRKKSRSLWEARLAELHQLVKWGDDRSPRETRPRPSRRLDEGFL